MSLRIGVLGAARITRSALLSPVRRIEDVEVTAIAARDLDRAARYAHWHGIPTVHATYESLLHAPNIDAVYIPTPAALHGRWTLAAISAGKHVLCEKPFTANADEASEVSSAAESSGLVVMEAHHSSFHPVIGRLREIIESGALGRVRRVAAWFHVPIPPGDDIRWNPHLGGGSLMDLGCYPLRLIRDVFGEPTVVSAGAHRVGEIDRRMTARLDVRGVEATIDCGLWSRRVIGSGLRVDGSNATLRLSGPFTPQFGGRIRIDGPGTRVRERPDRTSTYWLQLLAFREAVQRGGPNIGSPSEAVATMSIIDEIYRAAGMRPRMPADSSRPQGR